MTCTSSLSTVRARISCDPETVYKLSVLVQSLSIFEGACSIQTSRTASAARTSTSVRTTMAAASASAPTRSARSSAPALRVTNCNLTDAPVVTSTSAVSHHPCAVKYVRTPRARTSAAVSLVTCCKPMAQLAWVSFTFSSVSLTTSF